MPGHFSPDEAHVVGARYAGLSVFVPAQQRITTPVKICARNNLVVSRSTHTEVLLPRVTPCNPIEIG